MTEYYLENPDLRRQPKRNIAEYAAQNGILIPRIFNSLKDAKASGLKIIARSEHPQDYDGVSDIFASKILDKCEEDYTSFNDIVDEEYLKQYILNTCNNSTSRYKNAEYIKMHCEYLNIDSREFTKKLSYSFWEYISGFNITVTADRAIPNRHHITTQYVELSVNDAFHMINYTISENRKLEQHGKPLTSYLEKNIPILIEQYEHIRNLIRFDKNNCATMEFQFYNGNNYFLQYLKGRAMSESTFVLDCPKKDDEIEASFVIGATGSEGIICPVGTWYTHPDHDGQKYLPKREEGSFDLHNNSIFTEIMTRRRKLQIEMTDYSEQFFINIARKHCPQSRLFKPEISIICPTHDFVSEKEYVQAYHKAESRRDYPTIDIFCISDGRRALLKRV